MPSDFLSRLSQDDRDRLERIGQTLELEPRHHLLVRGEKGGDVFRVEKGSLEIVDRRSRPEVILDVLGPGELVGEMGFIDGTPRSADAFAGPGTVVTRWPVGDLQEALASDARFAARFWRALSEEVADRVREVTSNAVSGGLRGAGPTPGGNTDGGATILARSLLASSLGGLAKADQALRRDPKDTKAADKVADLLDLLALELERLQREGADPTTVGRAVRKLAQQVHPYLLRSVTAELSIARPDGFAGGPTVLRHVLAGEPVGDGPLGLAVDRWLMGLPRAQGLLARHRAACEIVEEFLGTHLGPVRLVLVNCAQGPLLERVYGLVSRREGELWIVEPTREALMELDTALPRGRIRVRMVHQRMGAPRQGGSLRALSDVDLIVADSLLDYLPARLATAITREAARLLTPRGRAVITALAPSHDQVLWTHLLEWPAILRRPRGLEAILHAAGYADVSVSAVQGSGLVAVAGRDS